MKRAFEIRPVFLTCAILTTIAIFYGSTRIYDHEAFWNSESPLGWQYASKIQSSLHIVPQRGDNILEVFNETLGFRRVFMISMPERTDKRDGFTVAAALSGIDYELREGVDGDKVSAKALPHKMDQNSKAVGCWRAHLNIWEEMVHKRTASALVFEDDADWDIGLKTQLLEFAKGARFVSNEPDHPHHSPYGDSWDLLWIGHCGSGPAVWNPRRYVIHNDSTVEPPESRQNVGRPDMSRWQNGPKGDNSTRIIYRAFGGVCTASYAISYRGAQKALYRMSMMPYNNPVDWGLNDLCADKAFNFNCIAPYPPIIGVHRPAGNSSAWSDIGYGDDAQRPVYDTGHSERLVFPTRMNIDRLLKGDSVFQSSFPDLTGPEMSIEEITRAIGHGETVPLNPEYESMSNDQLKQIHWDWVELE